jgi:hypothetical protein
MIFRKWTWRFFFMLGLSTWIMFMAMMVAQIINHGCHNYNTSTQIVILLDIVFTAVSYAFMQEDNNGRKNSKIKNTKRT